MPPPGLDCVKDGKTDAPGRYLYNVLKLLALMQVPNEVARPYGSQILLPTNPLNPGFLLDWIITNAPTSVRTGTIEPPIGSSDHCAVFFTGDVNMNRESRPLRC